MTESISTIVHNLRYIKKNFKYIWKVEILNESLVLPLIRQIITTDYVRNFLLITSKLHKFPFDKTLPIYFLLTNVILLSTNTCFSTFGRYVYIFGSHVHFYIPQNSLSSLQNQEKTHQRPYTFFHFFSIKGCKKFSLWLSCWYGSCWFFFSVQRSRRAKGFLIVIRWRFGRG